MKAFYLIGTAILLSLNSSLALAYGDGQSATGCHKPIFTEYQPATNKYTQSFREFSVVASSNTTPGSIEANVSIGEIKFHFANKDLTITQRKNGQYEVKGKLDRIVEHGFARVGFGAHSRPGCHHSDGILVRIQ